nr:RuvX/YqgF family protein [Spiroplasma clarkii]
MVEEFLTQLYEICQVSTEKVVKIDERLTTRFARAILIEANLSRKKQKANKDQLAAQLILETFLQQNK